jgi:hypothetical protein
MIIAIQAKTTAAKTIHKPLPKVTTKSVPGKRESMLSLTPKTSATFAAKAMVETIAVIMATKNVIVVIRWERCKRDNTKATVESAALTRCSTRIVRRVVSATFASLEESPTTDKMLVGTVYPNCGP